MFLSRLLAKNAPLADASLRLVRDGVIAPNTFVLDLATISENARQISAQAERSGVSIYWMLKQIGNNPLVADHLVTHFGGSMVVVDYASAHRFDMAGVKVGHVGHLVQTPRRLIPYMLSTSPEVVTVFSLAKLMEIDVAAAMMGIHQDILVRVYSHHGDFYHLQGGGIHVDSLAEFLVKAKPLRNISIVGFTSFPCLLFDAAGHQARLTTHANAVREAASIARDQGFEITQLNMPSLSTLDTVELLKGAGATHIEPGHAITGTTPLDMDSTLDTSILPAVAYATEVSHYHNGESYLYGGGYYSRGGLSKAYVCSGGSGSGSGGSGSSGSGEIVDTNMVDAMIDYYIPAQGRFAVGSAAVMLFRMQAFTSRGEVVVIEDASAPKANVLGRYSSQGEVLL